MAVWANISNLNCRECSEATKVSLGCEGLKEKRRIEGIEVDRCPRKCITAQSKIYLEAYAFYMDGHLPGPGDVFEQGNKVMEAIRFIEGEAGRIKDKK